jgi:hypothetical protein
MQSTGVSCAADISETMLKIKLDKRENTPLLSAYSEV